MTNEFEKTDRELINLYQHEITLTNELLIKRARENFAAFIAYTSDSYEFNWHHDFVAYKLQQFVEKKIPRLMLFEPPRHGKSQQGSRHLPAFIFGKRPTSKIIACSYAAELIQSMNLDAQAIIDSDEYRQIFPNVRLSNRNGGHGMRRTQTTFDIVGTGGYYTCAGVGGSVVGKGADYILIDDPVKNQEEADSPIARERTYKWFIGTLYHRLEKNGSILLLMTRWHEDDLAGRLIRDSKMNPELPQWEIVTLPAIRENDANDYDIRKVGEPLWEDKYDLNALNDIRLTLQSYWFPLYQQRPQREGGTIFREQWFGTFDDEPKFQQIDMFVDTAYTEKEQNDRTAIVTVALHGKNMFILNVAVVWKEFPELIEFMKEHIHKHGNQSTRVYIEPKASGLSVVQYMKRHSPFNIIAGTSPRESKEVRAKGVSPFVEAGRVFLPKHANWKTEFLHEVTGFPKAEHDDIVDAFVDALRRNFGQSPIQMSGFDLRDVRL